MVDINDIESTYLEATFGVMEPDMIYCDAASARAFGMDIPLEIADDTAVVITSAGWQIA